MAVAFSPDGQFLLTSSGDFTARLWETATGREIRDLEGHSGSIGSIAFSPDGQFILTGSEDKTARIWNAKTGEEIRQFQGHSEDVRSVAFSHDGRFILTGSWDGTSRLWNAVTGDEIRQFRGHSAAVLSVAFSLDGKSVLTGGEDNTARLWDALTGNETRRFEGHSESIISVAVSPDGRSILTGSEDGSARLWLSATGKEIQQFRGRRTAREWDAWLRDLATGKKNVQHRLYPGAILSVAFSQDGRFIVTGNYDGTAQLRDAVTGREINSFEEHLGPVLSVAVSPDGRSVLTGSYDRTAVLWDAATGNEIRRFDGVADFVKTVAFSHDNQIILMGGSDGTIHLWSTTAGKEIRRLQGHSDSINSIATSSDGQFILTGSSDKTARLWDAESGKEMRRFEGHLNDVESVAISSDGRLVLTGSYDGTARLWDAATGNEIRRFRTRLNTGGRAVAIFSDGRTILMDVGENTACLWDAATGKEIRRFNGQSGVSSVTYSRDERLILIGGWDGTATLWDATTGREIQRFQGHSKSIESVAFSPDGHSILTGSADGTPRLWDTKSGKEIQRFRGKSVAFSSDGRFILTENDRSASLWDRSTGREVCRLVSFRDGTWAVVDPEGRFDSNNLEEIRGLHWIMPDDPLRPLPLEIFLRDYYEPRLLPRILNGDLFKPVRSLSLLNRSQPQVKISDIRQQKDNLDLVTVTVEVSKSTGQSKLANRITAESGVFDVRLFRNGQIVGQSPRPSLASSAALPLNYSDDLLAWRQASLVKLDPTGKQTITFENVHLPRSPGLKQVAFSAYAFNHDRVKSQTHSRLFNLPPGLSPKKGRAFLISVGVNAYQDSSLNLRFAADDARLTQKVLCDRLQQSADFEQVVSISLLSDYGPDSRLTDKTATKANFKAVLDVLAGKQTDSRLLRDIANADKLSKATPEDLVVISFASHGDADSRGNFYLFPYDIGEGRGQSVTAEFLSRCISSDELSLWLRDVDAGDMVLIVDACHSAASVEGEGFKPGPMGSRGLGQLAYDKGMRILAASQADDVAIESEQVRQGLLTYALIRDGLEGQLADRRPKDGKIMLDEWLGYGAERVPGLYEEVKRGEVKQSGRGQRAKIVLVKQGKSLKRAAQQPQLFDFARKRRDIMLAKF
jgi:WD40 repeat protein